VAASDPPALTPEEARPAGYRYGGVFLITLVLVVFEVAAPAADWARAVALGLEGAALIVVVVTSRARWHTRRARGLAAGAVAVALVVAVATGVLPDDVTFVLGGLLAAAIPALLVRGLVRLVRDHGVTLQAVAGALAIYLIVGLVFAWAIAFISAVDSASYFAQGKHVPEGVRVYFSFAVLTTTGFGDYTAATGVGRALAVVEMLLGQLYLVTIIGVLVGNLAGRRRA
jgi:ion channel